MKDDDRTLALAVSTLAFAVVATVGVALSGVEKTGPLAKGGYGITVTTVSASS